MSDKSKSVSDLVIAARTRTGNPDLYVIFDQLPRFGTLRSGDGESHFDLIKEAPYNELLIFIENYQG